MAVLIEDVKWRTSARGRRYANVSISDASGQLIASCFDDGVAKDLEDAAKANLCGLLTVELDRQPGEETPRVAIRRLQRFEGLAANTRLKAVVRVCDPAAIAVLSRLVAGERGGRGELVLETVLPDGKTAKVRLGRDFALDAELAAKIETLPGVESVSLGTAEPPRLALVS